MTEKCPVCGFELIEVGFPKDIGYQYYCCPNNYNIFTFGGIKFV